MLLRSIQEYTEDDLVSRLVCINERINSLIKENASLDDISHLRELRIMLEKDKTLRECEVFLK